MADEKKRKMIRSTTCEGRVTNHSLFEKDTFDEGGPNEGTPSYKVELVIPFKDFEESDFENDIIDACVAEWGEDAEDEYLDGKIIAYKDGDDYAAERKERGKPADAYEGGVIIRAHTQFNLYGDNGPGGIAVFDEEVKEVRPANAAAIFRGCYGEAAVDINPYQDPRSKQKYVSYYLVAFQKRGGDPEKDRLAGAADHSALFKPVGRKSERKSRRG